MSLIFSARLKSQLQLEPKDLQNLKQNVLQHLKQKIEKNLEKNLFDNQMYAVFSVEKIEKIANPLAIGDKLFVLVTYVAQVAKPEVDQVYTAKIDGIVPSLGAAFINQTPVRVAISNFSADYKASPLAISNGIHSFTLNNLITFKITGVNLAKTQNSNTLEFRCTAHPYFEKIEQKFKDQVMESPG